MSLTPFLVAFGLTAILTFLAIQIFPRLGLLDQPAKYGLTRRPIPYFGGLAVVLGFLVAVFFFTPLTREVLGLLTGMSLLALTSFLDDACGLPPLVRLAVQVLAAGLLIIGGAGIAELPNPFGTPLSLTAIDWTLTWGASEYHFSLLADLFTVLWVVLLVNALNWCDGIPGLASGLTGLAALVLCLLAGRAGYHYFDQSIVITLAALLAGGAFAFTLFNFAPPRILLGDTGSMFFGFVLAALAIFAGGKIATTALVLGVPLLDALLVIGTRLLAGRAPWQGGEWDRQRQPVHLHHRLLAAGLSERQTALILLFACALFGAAALWLDTTFQKLLAFTCLGALVLLGQVWLAQRRIIV